MSAPQGFFGNLLDRAKGFAEDAAAKAKETAQDLPDNAEKLATEATAAVKEFAEELPETAKQLAEDAGTAVKDLFAKASSVPGEEADADQDGTESPS
jgi:hypothetical protein